MKTIAAAQGKWVGILKHFGIGDEFLRNVHGPCPLCGGKDRYRFDDKDGSGSYFCAGCGPGFGMDLIQKSTGLTFREAADQIDQIIGNIEVQEVKPKTDPAIRLRKIGKGLAPMDGINPVRLYLSARGLKPTPATRHHPGLGYYEGGRRAGTYPAMVHLFEGPNLEPLTFHVTYLTARGEKAPVQSAKKVMPAVGPLRGGCIRLYGAKEEVGIAEGIETAMAATQRHQVPCWAAYSATLLEQFQPPKGINRVVVFGDNDRSFTGQKSAFALAHRLKREGYEVSVRIPEQTGSDWADQVSA